MHLDPHTVPFTAEAWDERYRSKPALWSGQPNPHLVAETADLQTGDVLDVGSGEGADAIWLALRGWRVTGVDISSVATGRAARHAADAGVEIDWRIADVTRWRPDDSRFDLVSAQYFHLPKPLLGDVVRRLAASVRPGGSLLVVGHHPSDLQTTVPRPPDPERFFTGDDLVALLDEQRWQIVTNATPARTVSDPEGRPAVIHDTVFRARRLA